MLTHVLGNDNKILSLTFVNCHIGMSGFEAKGDDLS